MRKNGWAAAIGLASAALLLSACGGSSASSSSAAQTVQAAAGKPSSAALGGIQPGSTVLMVQKSALGYVLAEAAPAAQIRVIDVPPVIGAALLGLDHVQAGPEAEARLRAAYGR